MNNIQTSRTLSEDEPQARTVKSISPHFKHSSSRMSDSPGRSPFKKLISKDEVNRQGTRTSKYSNPKSINGSPSLEEWKKLHKCNKSSYSIKRTQCTFKTEASLLPDWKNLWYGTSKSQQQNKSVQCRRRCNWEYTWDPAFWWYRGRILMSSRLNKYNWRLFMIGHRL